MAKIFNRNVWFYFSETSELRIETFSMEDSMLFLKIKVDMGEKKERKSYLSLSLHDIDELIKYFTCISEDKEKLMKENKEGD